jgi:flagellar motor protein MotB
MKSLILSICVYIGYMSALQAMPCEQLPQTYSGIKDISDGERLAKRCRRFSPVWNDLGNLYEQVNQQQNALSAYQKSAKIGDPHLPHPWAGIGDVHRSQKRHKAAVKAYCRFFDAYRAQPKPAQYNIPDPAIRQYRDRLFHSLKIVGVDQLPEGCTLPPKKAKELTRSFKVVGATVELMVLFPLDKVSISSVFVPQIREVAKAVRASTQSTLIIEGHTDSTGTTSHNQHLSRRRAESVEHELRKLGLSRLKICAYGERQPKATNHTVEGRATNRRVEVRLGAKCSRSEVTYEYID